MKSIVHNLGLGDHIICAPIVARLASQHFDERIALPCFEHNLESVRSFYVNFPNIHIVPIKQESELDALPERILSIGHYSKIEQRPDEDFISWFYRQAEFSLEDREDYCPLWAAAQRFSDHFVTVSPPDQFGRRFQDCSPFIFKHHDISRGYVINELRSMLPIHEPGIKGSILLWSHVIRTATEIHCIDSSFLHLADAIPTTGKLFFHRYARSGDHNKNLALRKKWEILE